MELEKKVNLGMKVLDWFADFLRKPEGKIALIVILGSLAFGFIWGNSRYTDGVKDQKKTDSIANLEYKNQNAAIISDYKLQIKALSENNLAQQQRLESRDCTEEMRKYKTLFNELNVKTAQDVNVKIAERQKETEEKNLAKQSLKIETEKNRELSNFKNQIK